MAELKIYSSAPADSCEGIVFNYFKTKKDLPCSRSKMLWEAAIAYWGPTALIANGCNSRTIAAHLQLSKATLKKQLEYLESLSRDREIICQVEEDSKSGETVPARSDLEMFADAFVNLS